MQQVLLTLPILKGSFPPDGIPVYGFGAMLFVTFIVVTWWGTVRAKPIGMPPAKFQDFTIWVFIAGIIGARVLYMAQYAHQFPDQSLAGLLGAFFKIWEGGIIFYGSALGGAIGYGLFYWFVMRRLDVSGWQLADVVAPLLALGLAIGRIGCYLNGCCWGQVACEECVTVPLGAAHFPLLPAHARAQLVSEQQLQTTTGFAIKPREPGSGLDDPRAYVTAVEKGSPADVAGLKPGDRIVKVNGEPNSIVVVLSGPDAAVAAAANAAKVAGAKLSEGQGGRIRVNFETFEQYRTGRPEMLQAAPELTLVATDRLEELTRDWPRGKSRLILGVEREGQAKELASFAPVSVGLYPTQLYETVSMVLLIFVLLAFYPYRRHDGQLMTLLMVGYAIHRFINESLRIEPLIKGTPFTLSQWGSVVILLGAVGMEIYLWCVMPSRWTKPVVVPPPPATTTTEQKPPAS